MLIVLSIGVAVIMPSLGFSLIGFPLGSSVIGSSFSPQSSSGSAVIDSPLGSSMLFFLHVTIFFLSKTVSLTCFNNFNKTDRDKMNEEILT